MATNYTGNQGSTQAPSGPPTPDANPVASLPADGDPLNAASIAQSHKTAMDWIAWLTKPRAIASAWAQAIKIFRSAAGHKRFGVDHLGYPMGRIQTWRENWFWGPLLIAANPAAVGPTSEGGWHFVGLQTGGGTGSVAADAPPPTAPGGRRLTIQVSNNAGDYAYAQRTAFARFQTDVQVAMEWDLEIPVLTGEGIAMGFSFASVLTGGAHGPIAQFYNLGGSGNWRCHTDDGTTLDDQDSGVAIGTSRKRFRIEYHGGSVDDAGTERVLFFIEGAPVGNLTTNMPSAAASPFAFLFFGMINAGGTDGAMSVGPVSFGANLDVDAF